MRRITSLAMAVGGLATLGASPVPRGLAGVQPGLWEVSRSASGAAARRVCLAHAIDLAEFEHRGERCQRTILRDEAAGVVVDLACARGDFARSTIRVTTPRSLKLETTGIHRGQPFDYKLYARRVGNCPVAGKR